MLAEVGVVEDLMLMLSLTLILLSLHRAQAVVM